MDIRKLQRAIVDGLEDVKAQNISVFNTEHLSAMFERVIIASGTSNRQTKALASSVRDSVKSQGLQVLATEGEDNGEWIIVDCGAAVAHIMQPAIREYYHLEEIWGGKAVRLKLGAATGGLVKASEPEPAGKTVPTRAAGRSTGRRSADDPSAAAAQRQPPTTRRPRAAAGSLQASPSSAPTQQRPSLPRSAVASANAPARKVAKKAARTAVDQTGGGRDGARTVAAKAPARKLPTKKAARPR